MTSDWEDIMFYVACCYGDINIVRQYLIINASLFHKCKDFGLMRAVDNCFGNSGTTFIENQLYSDFCGESNRIAVIKLLLENGATEIENTIWSPLCIAVILDDIDVLNLILKYKAYSTNSASFAIGHARSLDTAKMLMRYGFPITSVTIESAFGYEREELLYYLIRINLITPNDLPVDNFIDSGSKEANTRYIALFNKLDTYYKSKNKICIRT